MKLDIGVVITTYNRKNKLRSLLERLLKMPFNYGKVILIVVNDGSTDGTGEMIINFYPQVVHLKGDGSYYFTKSLNEGIKYAVENDVDAVITINDDCHIDDEYFNYCYHALMKSRDTIFAPVTLNINNKTHVLDCGYKISWFPFYKLKPIYKNFNYEQLPESFAIDTIGGRGLLIPTYIFQKIGLYDDKTFKQYGSDDEFLLRVAQAGYKILVDKKLVLYDFELRTQSTSGIINNYRNLFRLKSDANIFNSIVLILRYCPKSLMIISLLFSIAAKLVTPIIKQYHINEN